MLRGLTEDFKAAGHEVTVLLDARIARFNPPLQADNIRQVNKLEEFEQVLKAALSWAEAAYMVAPESDGILHYLTKRVESSNARSLNCSASAIAQASDKAKVAEHAKQLGLNFPKTVQLKPSDSIEAMAETVENEVGFPAVIKPVSSAGCGGLSVVQEAFEVEAAVDKIFGEAGNVGVCAQEFVQGVPASVSLLCRGEEVLPLSLNLQDLTLASPEDESNYNGGLVPFDYPLKPEAFEAAKRLTHSFRGLFGYVGVDVILGTQKVYVMEVNPRLTTSYVGLRKASKLNIADALLKEEAAHNVEFNGVCCFSKVPIERPIIFAWQNFCALEALVSPPFPLYGQETSYGMLRSCGATTEQALQQMHKAKEELKDIWEKGQKPW
jgi:predicted ATP-grasp superfamily ATP-dependent carboligase